MVAQLNDDRDIQNVLNGAPDSTGLKAVLSTLDSKKQILVFGHAITMPIVLKTREYNEVFYKEICQNTPEAVETKELINTIF